MNKADKIPVFVIETLSSSNLSIQKPRLFQPSVRREKDRVKGGKLLWKTK